MSNFSAKFWSRNHKPNRKGFTLIELMIVLAIVGILFGIFAAIGTSSMQKSKYAVVKTDFKAFQIGIEQTLKENQGVIVGATPTSIIQAINANLDSNLQFNPSTFKCQRLDPYGNPYQIFVNLAPHAAAGTATSTTSGIAPLVTFTSVANPGTVAPPSGDPNASDVVVVIRCAGSNGKTTAYVGANTPTNTTYQTSIMDSFDIIFVDQMSNGDTKAATYGFPTGNIGNVANTVTGDLTQMFAYN